MFDGFRWTRAGGPGRTSALDTESEAQVQRPRPASSPVPKQHAGSAGYDQGKGDYIHKYGQGKGDCGLCMGIEEKHINILFLYYSIPSYLPFYLSCMFPRFPFSPLHSIFEILKCFALFSGPRSRQHHFLKLASQFIVISRPGFANQDQGPVQGGPSWG